MGAQSKRKGSNFAAYSSGAIVLQAQRAKHIQCKNLAKAIWQPCLVLLEQEEMAAAMSIGEGGNVEVEAPNIFSRAHMATLVTSLRIFNYEVETGRWLQ